MIKISIIIPVFNASEFLLETYESINMQTFQDYEIIFVDDCSTDNSYMILEKLSNSSCKVKVYRNDSNQGTAYSRNYGIAQSTGNYIYFMDADDILSPDCLNLLATAASKNNYPDLVIANVSCPNYSYTPFTSSYLEDNSEIREQYFHHKMFEMPWNKLINKLFLINNNLWFNQDCYYEDTLWSFKVVLSASSQVLISKVTYYYRLSDSQKTSVKDILFVSKEKVKVFSEMKALLINKETDNSAKSYLMEISDSFLLYILRSSICKNDKIAFYKQIRDLFSINEVKRISKEVMSNGMKLFILYHLMPQKIGYYYSVIFSKITEKWSA